MRDGATTEECTDRWCAKRRSRRVTARLIRSRRDDGRADLDVAAHRLRVRADLTGQMGDCLDDIRLPGTAPQSGDRRAS